MISRWWVTALFLFLLGCGLCWETVHRSTIIIPTAPSPSLHAAVPLEADFAIPVLMYHRICDLTPEEARSPLLRDLTVAPRAFNQQMAYLASHGFTVLTVEEIAASLQAHLPLPVKGVAITMDDGYHDNFSQAFPILQRYHSPATIFLVSSTIQTPGHLSWREIEQMRSMISYQSHTVNHLDLTMLPTDKLKYELAEAKSMLEANLHCRINHLAYPSGAFNTNVIAATRACGYQCAWKKGGGPVTPFDDPYLLPRERVRGDTTMEEFARIVWSGVCQHHVTRPSRLHISTKFTTYPINPSPLPHKSLDAVC